jgi:hypothetical protein
MSNPSRASLLRRLIGRRAPADDIDAADMGTAIGLDFILDQAPPPPPDRDVDSVTPGLHWMGRPAR